jgi:hypothetical protein
MLAQISIRVRLIFLMLTTLPTTIAANHLDRMVETDMMSVTPCGADSQCEQGSRALKQRAMLCD